MKHQERYGIREFADMVGVSMNTLRRWDREGILVAGRTPTNRRVYTEAHLQQVLERADGAGNGNERTKMA